MRWLTINQAARECGCTRWTAMRRLRALESRLGRPVLVRKVHQGKKKFLVSRLDLKRAFRDVFDVDEDQDDLAEIRTGIETLLAGQVQLGKEIRAVRESQKPVRVGAPAPPLQVRKHGHQGT